MTKHEAIAELKGTVAAGALFVNHDDMERFCDAVDALDSMPVVEWRSVDTPPPPDDCEMALLTVFDETMRRREVVSGIWFDDSGWDADFDDPYTVLAWAPMPEPFGE